VDWENPVQVTLPQEAAKLTESADPVWQWVMQTLEYSLHHKLIEQAVVRCKHCRQLAIQVFQISYPITTTPGVFISPN